MEEMQEKHQDRKLFNKAKEITREFQPSLKVIKDKNGEVLTEKNLI